jgi:glyoxylase-like metal-dependent hydrolase (beta-lactamase superfamily II)
MNSPLLLTSSGAINVFVDRCGQIDTNTGFIENADRLEAILIDAPFDSFQRSRAILQPHTRIIAVLFTHCHWDHVGDGHRFRAMGAQTYAHRADRAIIENPDLIPSSFSFGIAPLPCKIDREVADRDIIFPCDWLRIHCRWVPGHGAGDLTFYAEQLGCVFVGDTLFKGCVGRSDLPGGNMELLISGIVEKILSLPDQTVVIPGHGRFTTVAEEKANNEFLQ